MPIEIPSQNCQDLGRKGLRVLSRRSLLCVLLGAFGVARAADNAEAIDDQFLEYLADFEGEQEDWTLFAVATPAERVRKTEKPAPEQAQ